MPATACEALMMHFCVPVVAALAVTKPSAVTEQPLLPLSRLNVTAPLLFDVKWLTTLNTSPYLTLVRLARSKLAVGVL